MDVSWEGEEVAEISCVNMIVRSGLVSFALNYAAVNVNYHYGTIVTPTLRVRMLGVSRSLFQRTLLESLMKDT